MIPLGEWLPDQAAYNSPGSTVATNVIPTARGYTPMKALVTHTSALDTRVRGAGIVRKDDGESYHYAGDDSKLYRLDPGQSSWTDVSRAEGYHTTPDEVWEFARFDNRVICTNFADEIQMADIGGGSFSDLSASAPRAYHLAVVDNFVVAGNTSDEFDGNVPNRVRWSAIGDPTDWTVSATTQSDYQDLEGDGGWVQRVCGGEYGVIIQERAIWRMSYVGSPAVFRFDNTLPGYGTPAPSSIVQYGNNIYLLTQDGFYVISNGMQITPIGNEKVDRTFWSEVDDNYVLRTVGALDPVNKLIFWAYSTTNAVNGTPDRMLVYSITNNKWARVDVSTQWIYTGAAIGESLEGLDAYATDLADLSFSLDSRTWMGGRIRISHFDADNQLGFFTGSNLTATIETQEAEIFSGSRALVSSVRPIVDGGTTTIAMGTRSRQQDDVSYGSAISVNAAGECPQRAEGRYHRARLSITGDWGEALGLDITKAVRSGTR